MEPEIITSPDPSDLARFRHAIETARASADFVIVACHWGYAGIIREQDVPASSTHG